MRAVYGRWVLLAAACVATLCLQGCPTPQPPVAPPPDASDAAPAPVLEGGSLHSYMCPIGDGGSAWTCQDGLTTPVGTCAKFGCVPASP